MKKFWEFIDNGWIREEKIGPTLVNQVVAKAKRSLKSAALLLADGDAEGSYELAYEAMLLSGRALVFSFDYRPRAAGSHKIVVDFVKKSLPKEAATVTLKFDKMRKNRHYLIYGAGLAISEAEAKNAISSAKSLMVKIEKIIDRKSPQRKMKI